MYLLMGTADFGGIIGIGQIFLLLMSLGFVIALAIIATRFVASSRLKSYNRNIKVIESVGVGFQNSLWLVQVGKKIVLVGISKDRITFLQNIDEEDIDLEPLAEPSGSSFKNFFDIYIKKNKGDEDENGES